METELLRHLLVVYRISAISEKEAEFLDIFLAYKSSYLITYRAKFTLLDISGALPISECYLPVDVPPLVSQLLFDVVKSFATLLSGSDLTKDSVVRSRACLLESTLLRLIEVIKTECVV